MIELAALETPSLKPEQRPCVIDPRLAMSEWGATTVARLAVNFELWMSAFARQIVRTPGDHLDGAGCEALVPRSFPWSQRGVDRAREARLARDELEHWSHAAHCSELSRVRLHYIGDRPDESITPRLADPLLHERYLYFHQTLCEHVDALSTTKPKDDTSRLRLLGSERQGAESDWPLRDCYLETLALAASLEPRSPFVLSRLESDAPSAPALCDYLCSWKLSVRAVPRRGGRQARTLREALGRMEIAPVVWSGIRLTAVYVAFARPLLDQGRRPIAAHATNPWGAARVFWHEI
ncbi:MAG TPA: hypothetical protein VM686_14385 [Polyangiaceae bacterium]|jgi:hypothetical protein|nr:hypothetical protein [Polyangiaceae bacterium]